MDEEARCPSCGAGADGVTAVCAACGAQLGSEDAAGQLSTGARGRYKRPGVTPARLALLGINLALFVICAALTASQFLLPPPPAQRLPPGVPSSATAPTLEATSAAEPGFTTVTATATARAKGNGGSGTGQLPTATSTSTLAPATPTAAAAATATATATPTPTPGQGA